MASNAQDRSQVLDALERQLAAATTIDDETAHRSTRALMPGSTSLVLSQLPRRVCLAEAATRVADAYNVLHGGAFNRVVRRGGAVVVETDDRGFPFASPEPEDVLVAMETTLLFLHALMVLVAPDQAARGLTGIALRRARGPAALPFFRLGRVRYGAGVYALRYNACVADEVVPRPPRSRLTYEAALGTQVDVLRSLTVGAVPGLAHSVEALAREGASQLEAAARLGISPATLRRRLAEEGTSFRVIRAAALRAKADPLLAGGIALPDVAARLGFSDVRSFNRAYKAWTGRTPSAARRQS